MDMPTPPPEELDMQTVDMERKSALQFLASLLRFRSGWFAKHALQRFEGFGKPGEEFASGKGLGKYQTETAGAGESTAPRPSRPGCNRGVPRAGSLSLGR